MNEFDEFDWMGPVPPDKPVDVPWVPGISPGDAVEALLAALSLDRGDCVGARRHASMITDIRARAACLSRFPRINA